MLSIETEARVAKLFLTIAEGEKAVEINRQVLSEQLDFDPYQMFKRLDSRGKNVIDEFDIVDFLKVNSIYATYNEARFIIFFYDKDCDGTLDYKEFLNLILSEFNYSLRRIARERVGYIYNRLTLPYDVEYSLSKLFERELDLVRNLDIALSDVKARYDFNVHELFSSIQSYSNLTSENIRKFLTRNGVDANEGEVLAIVRRLDTNGDGTVSFSELKRLFAFPSGVVVDNLKESFTRSNFYNSKTAYESPLRRTVSPKRYYSPERSLRMGSPFRTTYTNPIVSRSPLRTLIRSPQRNTVRSPLRSQVLNKSGESFNRTKVTNLSSTSTNFKSSFSSLSYEEENFLNYVKDLIGIENEIERTKSDLVLRSDFNVEDAFRIFELDGRGYLTELDIKYGLNALDIFPSAEEINLLIKRYDNLNEGVISYANFFEIVAPYDIEYRRTLENRIPSSSYVSRFGKPDVFLPTTKLFLQNLLNLILRSEARIEGWRQRLNKLPRFNARQIFEKIDRFDKNYFIETDLANYFTRNDFSFLNRDLDLLILRFDRSRDGRVTFLEFSDELYPKSTQFFSL